jgi:hypothetical protein
MVLGNRNQPNFFLVISYSLNFDDMCTTYLPTLYLAAEHERNSRRFFRSLGVRRRQAIDRAEHQRLRKKPDRLIRKLEDRRPRSVGLLLLHGGHATASERVREDGRTDGRLWNLRGFPRPFTAEREKEIEKLREKPREKKGRSAGNRAAEGGARRAVRSNGLQGARGWT